MVTLAASEPALAVSVDPGNFPKKPSLEYALTSGSNPTAALKDIECSSEDSLVTLFETLDQTFSSTKEQASNRQPVNQRFVNQNDTGIEHSPVHPDSIAFAALAVLILSLIARKKSGWLKPSH
ncbi:MAG: hypothetical protein MI976_26350 [Pseudomonadales bacterium]|nr:hypothetical protein [Pseudomonadales bacterium]